jgi:hypothetical protein
MGFFDYVTFELPAPDGRQVKPKSFQTKSLWSTSDQFTVTATGRLILHKRRYENGDWKNPIHVADIDMDYHGDLVIHGDAADGHCVDYAIRFTHGTVEWIRPLESLSELHQLWLIDRGR